MAKPFPVKVANAVDEDVDDAAGGGVDGVAVVEPLLPPPPQAISSGARSRLNTISVVQREMCCKRLGMGNSHLHITHARLQRTATLVQSRADEELHETSLSDAQPAASTTDLISQKKSEDPFGIDGSSATPTRCCLQQEHSRVQALQRYCLLLTRHARCQSPARSQ